MNSKIVAVAWREFKATVLTKAFLVAALIVPAALMGLAALGPLLFASKAPPLAGTVAVVDPGGALADAVRSEFSPERLNEPLIDISAAAAAAATPGAVPSLPSRFDVELELEFHDAESALPELKAKVQNEELIAVVTSVPPADRADDDAPAAVIYVPSGMNVKHTSVIERATRRAAERVRIEAAGLDVEQVRELSRSPRQETIRISSGGREAPEGEMVKAFKMIVPMAFMMLLWMGAFVSSNYVLTTTIEEKSNKVIEVLLSAVSPLQLMAGKIIGQGLVGLVMLVMYSGLGIAALVFFLYADLVRWSDLAYLGLFYIMAYFMVASIMAAIGGAVNELREAQSLMTPAMILLMIPLLLWLPISDAPNGALATVTSFVPPLTPFVMILRITGTETIPIWQIAVSLVIGYAAMVGMIWMAAKIFRVGVLMSGKPPNPIDLLRWLRYE